MKWYKRDPDDAVKLAPGQLRFGGGQFPPKVYVPHVVYVVGQRLGPCKIGITTDLDRRLRSLQTGCPFGLEVFWTTVVASREIAREVEAFALETFKNTKAQGEWLHMSPELIIQAIEGAV